MFPSFPIPFLRLPVGCIQQKRTPWPIPWRSFASDFVSHGFQTQLRWCLNRELSDSGIAWNSYGFNSWRSTKPSRNQATNELGTGMINGSRELNVGQTQIWIDMGHMDQNFTPAIPFFRSKMTCTDPWGNVAAKCCHQLMIFSCERPVKDRKIAAVVSFNAVKPWSLRKSPPGGMIRSILVRHRKVT
jgi:hypothetical protein